MKRIKTLQGKKLRLIEANTVTMRQAIFVVMVCITMMCPLSAKTAGKWEFLGPEGATIPGRFTLSPAAPDAIYAAEFVPLFKTTDAGEHWQRLSDAPLNVHAVAVSLSDPNVVYAQGLTNPPNKPIARTDDGGLTWVALTQPARDDALVFFNDLAVHPQNPMTVYGVWGYFFRSVDGGHTWQEIRNGLRNSVRPDDPNFVGLWRVAVDPNHPEVIYTAGLLGVFKSTDGGDTWREITQGLTIPANEGIDVQSIAVDPVNTENVYLCIGGVSEPNFWGIYGSSDGGERWRNLTADKVAPQTLFTRLSVSPADSRCLYAASFQGIFQSVDGGDTWQLIWKGQRVQDIAVHPTNPQRIYANVYNIGFLRSDDGGRTWMPKVHGMDAVFLGALAISRSNSAIVCSGGQGFYHSADGGQTWQLTGAEPGASWSEYGIIDFSDIAINPSDPGIICAVTDTARGLARSEDSGQSWTILNSLDAPAKYVAFDLVEPVILYVSTLSAQKPGALLRSTDGGQTWKDVTPDFVPLLPPWREIRLVENLVFYPTNPRIIFLANGVGIARSPDRGETWENISQGLPEAIKSVAIDPINGDWLFAADGSHVYRSVNGGQRWDMVASIAADLLTISSAGASVAVYAAGGKQVWLSTDAGNNWQRIDEGLPRFEFVSGNIRKIVAHPAEARTVLIATTRGIFRYRSDDVVAAVLPQSRDFTTWGAVKDGRLLPNYPNPFNSETWIPFQLAQDSNVAVSIYNATGQLMRRMIIGHRDAGSYTSKDSAAYWDGKDNAGDPVASGAYFYSIEAGAFQATRKMIVQR